MKMASKISAAFVTLTTLVAISGVTGYYGVTRLSESLHYVTGPAWDTADGAKDGAINMQTQMLVIDKVFSGFAEYDNVAEEIKLFSDQAHEALLRMKQSGLLGEDNIRQADDAEKTYMEAADRVLERFKVFNIIDNRLEDNFFEFQMLMTETEEIGDGIFDQMSKNPNKIISWDTGIKHAWTAADGAMMSQIGILKSIYFYRRMLEFIDLKGSIAGIQESNKMLDDEVRAVIAHPVFKKNNVADGFYKGLSYSDALAQGRTTHINDFTESIEAFNAYYDARKEYETVSAAMLAVLEEMQSLGNKTIEAEMGNINSVINISNSMMIIVVIIAVLISIMMGFFILRSVKMQLGQDPAELMKISEALAQGHLEMKLDKDAVGVYASIVQTVQKLTEIIGGIKSGASEVNIASEQVSQGNTNLSQRTQEQASSLEEVASSMEEMTGTVNQNSENAQHANQLAIAAREQADTGGMVVNEAVVAMSEINAASKQIADIIGVIDEIAFQTNLLALNAAVEAARAGEQGRGFAVVASEVRNLAGRSATAAKEIKELIKNSVENVQNGSRLVSESGGALSEIVDSVKKVSDIVAEIAAASKEQSDGINQVNKALLQMDEMTQQNASLVEEAAAASEAMGAQAQELDALVSFFKLNQSDYVKHSGVAHPAGNQAVSHKSAPKLSKSTSSESVKTASLPHEKENKED
ncbi:MAG: methyl-accepting chemotaxis protein, partial [Gammaproteobacteria bacterium]|nr:methyl-accepting chemotaxis protein [Gammaproteobacteria bacterium]